MLLMLMSRLIVAWLIMPLSATFDALATFRATFTATSASAASPPPAARALGMVAIAMFAVAFAVDFADVVLVAHGLVGLGFNFGLDFLVWNVGDNRRQRRRCDQRSGDNGTRFYRFAALDNEVRAVGDGLVRGN